MLKTLCRFIQSQETRHVTLAQGCAAFCAVVLARNFTESILESEQVLGFSPVVRYSFYMFFDHFFLFYVSVFLWLMVCLSFLSGEEVKRVAKMAVLFSPVILLPPLIDIFLSKGVGYRLGYLAGVEEALPALQFLDLRSQLVQVTWGQRIEVLLVCWLASAYVWLKRSSWTRSAAAFVAAYLIMFAHGLPQALADIPRAFGSELGIRAIMGGGLVDVDSQNYSFYMLMLAIPAMLILIRRHNRRIWQELLVGLQKGRWWACGLACLAGSSLGFLLFMQDYRMTFVNPYNYLALVASVGALVIASARPGRFWLVVFAAFLAGFLSMNVGWALALLAACVFLLSRFRKTLLAVLLLSFAGGLSLFAQENTFGAILPGGRERISAFARYRQAREYFLQKDWARAVASYEEAKASGFTNHELHERLAESRVNRGLLDAAIAPFYDAIATSRNDPEPYLGLAGVFITRGEFNEAIHIYVDGIEDGVQPDRFHLEMGRIYSRIGDFDRARSSLKKAAVMGARRDILYQALADMASLLSDSRKALDLYRRVLRYNPRFGLAYNGMATILHMDGQYEAAAQLYKKALEILPNNPTILNNAGAVYIELNKPNEAYKYVSRALAIYPMLAEGYYNLGRIFEMAGARPEAISNYRKALDVNPKVLGAREALEALGEVNWLEEE